MSKRKSGKAVSSGKTGKAVTKGRKAPPAIPNWAKERAKKDDFYSCVIKPAIDSPESVVDKVRVLQNSMPYIDDSGAFKAVMDAMSATRYDIPPSVQSVAADLLGPVFDLYFSFDMEELRYYPARIFPRDDTARDGRGDLELERAIEQIESIITGSRLYGIPRPKMMGMVGSARETDKSVDILEVIFNTGSLMPHSPGHGDWPLEIKIFVPVIREQETEKTDDGLFVKRRYHVPSDIKWSFKEDVKYGGLQMFDSRYFE